MAAMLGRAARRHNSCCGHGRHCEDWSHQNANWATTRQAQRRVERRGWTREADLELDVVNSDENLNGAERYSDAPGVV